MKKIFLIGGLSESGKSTVGKYLDSKGIKRLKFVTYLKRIMEAEGAQGDFQEWNEKTEKERPGWLWKKFIDEFEKELTESGIEKCCVESLYNPRFGEFLKRNMKDDVKIVYVDIPQEIRLERQVIRQNLASLEEAAKLLVPRDIRKEEWGGSKVKDIADFVIDNSDSVEELYRKIEEIINTP